MKKPTQTRKPVRENRSRLSRLIEQNLENVEIVLGVRGAIIDKLQNMAEDLAKIEPDDLMPMADSLKTAFGPNVASRFNTAVTGKLRELVTAIGAAKDVIGGEIDRLEQASGGGAANDMGMEDDAGMGDENLGGGDDMPQGDDAMGMGDEGGEMPSGDTGEGMGDEGETDLNDLPPLGDDEKMNAAGRAKKESATRRGRRLVEYTSGNFDANMHSLSAFDPRAGTIALSIHDMIDSGRFDGEERKGLANVLSHLAAFAPDVRHWEDPDAKVDAALLAAKVDTRLPEVRGIVAKLKKLAHMISLKHDGMMESKKIARGIKTLSESKNPDAVILTEFRRVLASTKNPTRSVKMVAEKFAIDASDVVSIVREAKAKIAPKKKVRCEIVREFDMKPTPKSKRGMFKDVPQADLQKRLTAAKKSMKAKEDKGEKVPHELRSKVSELDFALRAKHDWGKVKESNVRWMDVVESDLPEDEKLEEQVPQKPKTPADMRADQDAKKQADAQAAQANPQANAQGKAPAKQGQAPKGLAPFQKGAQSNPQSNPQQGAAPAMGQQQQGQQQQGQQQQGQQKLQQPQQAAGQGQAPLVPPNMKPTTPVGSAPKVEPQMPKMPGKEMKSVPSMNNDIPAVTLMSKPTPFPTPGKPLMNTGGQTNQTVAEKRTRR